MIPAPSSLAGSLAVPIAPNPQGGQEMRFMNEYEIADAAVRFDPATHRNLAVATLIVARLANWTNRNSDGWAYWPKPARAANRLMELIEGVDRFDPEDVTTADLKRAFTPIKSFLTRQGVDHAEIFEVLA